VVDTEGVRAVGERASTTVCGKNEVPPSYMPRMGTQRTRRGDTRAADKARGWEEGGRESEAKSKPRMESGRWEGGKERAGDGAASERRGWGGE
jgi:hypothetical protein